MVLHVLNAQSPITLLHRHSFRAHYTCPTQQTPVASMISTPAPPPPIVVPMLTAQQISLFKLTARTLSEDERVARSYERAKAIALPYSKSCCQLVSLTLASSELHVRLDLSASDVLNYGPRLWDMLWDPLLPLDLGTFTIIAAHYNIAVGTVVRYLHNRPDLTPLVQSLLKLETVGLFLLSERGHGLDAFNLETTATKHGDEFILHTPRETAAKYVSRL